MKLRDFPMDILVLLAILLAWLLIQFWLFPKLGVPT